MNGKIRRTATKVFISLNGGETLMNLRNALGLKVGSHPFDDRDLNDVRIGTYCSRKILTAPESILKPSVRSKCLLAKKDFRADSPETTMTVSCMSIIVMSGRWRRCATITLTRSMLN